MARANRSEQSNAGVINLGRKGESAKSLLSSILSILVGLLIGFVILVLISIINSSNTIVDAFSGFGILLSGPFSALNITQSVGDIIFYATPLILTGLSVAIAYKTGLFNIGAPGQYLAGTFGSLMVALNIETGSNRALGILVWILALLAGIICGVLWGMIPGLLKALFGINEVIVCIMTNWIAANGVTWIFESTTYLHNIPEGKTAYLFKPLSESLNICNYTPKLGLDKLFSGSYIDMGILIAIAVAIGLWVLMNKTVLGYELKACGANRDSARYAGLNDKKYIVISMAIAGGLAALGGSLYFLNSGIEFNYKAVYQTLPVNGFNGIPVALLANCNPIGVIFSALFIRYISAGGKYLSLAHFNQYFADIVVALIIYLAGFSRVFRDLAGKLVERFNEFKTKVKTRHNSTDKGGK